MRVPVTGSTGRVRWLWLVAPATLAALLTLIAMVFPGGSLYVLSYAVLFWILTTALWIVLLCVPRYRRSPGIVVAPLVAALTCATVAADLPMRAAFAVSEPALTAYVRSLPLHPDSVTVGDAESGLGVEWVGLFPVGRAVRHVDRADLGVIGSGGWLEFCGLTYVHGERLRTYRFSSVDRLSDSWYATCEDF
ncbi:hypothetical protein [Nonomuraea harbinensis]|uniref:DUF1109 domain-containing protein n=1 Tax=Nonomuraea harbinensis TaxID=1286938 RepID=A0ABW1BWX0_9ACTN|nr:hypothetical protein [Nonomuraea harbinensis]